MMFTSAATGYAACMAFIRGITGTGKDMGNFYEDMIRIMTRVLIPISIVIALILVSQGTPENYTANLTVQTLEGKIRISPWDRWQRWLPLSIWEPTEAAFGGQFIDSSGEPDHSFQYGRNVCNGNSARSLRDRLWTYVP